MTSIADRYPPGMSRCDAAGLAGNCGPECSGFQGGECPIQEEIQETVDKESRDKLMAQTQEVVEALRKKPELLCQVFLLLGAHRIATPWRQKGENFYRYNARFGTEKPIATISKSLRGWEGHYGGIHRIMESLEMAQAEADRHLWGKGWTLP